MGGQVTSMKVQETDRRLNVPPLLTTRFRRCAARRLRELEARRTTPYYRHEIVREGNRWLVVAMQNVAVPS